MTKSRDSFILNKRKNISKTFSSNFNHNTIEGENHSTVVLRIIADTAKEGKSDGENKSTDVLLNKLIDINQKQNKLLEKNNNTSQNLNFILFIIASLSFLSAFASTQIAALQLQATNKDPTGLALFYCVFTIAIILLFIFGGVSIWDNRKKFDETTTILGISALVFGLICIISIFLPWIIPENLADINFTLISIVGEFSVISALFIYTYWRKNIKINT